MAMLRSRLFALTILALPATVFGSPGPADNALVCTGGAYRLSPPGVAAAVYFNLKNQTDGDITLTGATSAVSPRVEIHKSAMENGMMTMTPMAELAVAKGQTLAFKPGGLHLMVFVPKTNLKVGDTVNFQLLTKSGKSWPCQTKVKKHL